MSTSRLARVVIAGVAASAIGAWSAQRRDDPLPRAHVAVVGPVMRLAPSDAAVYGVSPTRIAEPVASVATRHFASTNGRSFDLEDPGIAAFLDRMAPLARRGDPEAAYRVYQSEALCGSIDPLRASMRESVAYEIGAMAKLKSGVDSLDTVCAGVTPAQVQERFVFLEQAIRAGNREAVLDFRTEGPLGFDLDALDPTDARLIEWQRRANAYLEVLAVQGDRDAWMRLSGDYQMGRAVRQDYQAAIKYRIALVLSREPDHDPDSIGYVKDMALTMQPDAVRNAIEQGRALAERFPFKPS